MFHPHHSIMRYSVYCVYRTAMAAQNIKKKKQKTHIHIPEQASNEYLMGNLILQFAPPSHHLQTFFPLSVRIFSPLFDSNNICLNRADISIKSLKVSIKNSSPARGTWNWIRGAVVEPMAYWQKTEIDFNPNAICCPIGFLWNSYLHL